MSQVQEPSFLLIHGAGGSHSKWRALMQDMPGNLAQAIDLPGHGNDQSDCKTSVEDMAEYIRSTLVKPVVVVGHSMGGLIGIELASRSRFVQGLVLINSHFELPVHPGILQQLEQGVFPEALFYASYAKSTSQKLLHAEREELAQTPVSVAFADFRACDAYKSGSNKLAALQIPVLAVYGDSDRLLPKDAKANMQAVCPAARIEVVSQSGHYAILEQPQFVREILFSFQTTKEEM